MCSLKAWASIISRHRPVLIQDYSFKYWIGKGRGVEALLPFFFYACLAFFVVKMALPSTGMGCSAYLKGAGEETSFDATESLQCIAASGVRTAFAALAFFVLFAALLFLFGLNDREPKREVVKNIARILAFACWVLLHLAHISSNVQANVSFIFFSTLFI